MAALVAVVGVPVISPVVVLRLRPAGKAGLTEYDVTVPPLLLAELVVMPVPTQYEAVVKV